MLNNKKKKKGFTLIELIIVIAIIAILAAIAIPKFGDIRKNAALKSDIANAKVVANAASALIADGTIKVPSADLKINIKTKAIDGGGTGYVTTDVAKNLTDSLQSIPNPESSGYKSFVVKIDNSGNVTVSMNKTEDLTIGDALYPQVN